MKPEMNVFQHPVATVFIDDSPAFVHSVALTVEPSTHIFSKPLEELEFINITKPLTIDKLEGCLTALYEVGSLQEECQ